jgi:hypothetical protein
MKLADGSEFKLGMTVYTASDTSIQTSPETHVVNAYMYDGRTVYEIMRIGSACGTDLLHYYSSREAAMRALIEKYRQKIAQIEDIIQGIEESL